MQKQNETRLSLWSVWSYEKAEQRINAQSEQGLHLERARPFTSTFRRDPSARYTYRLDYQPDLRGRGQIQEYLDLYADAGWEHVCTSVGWYYFRRPWQPGEQPAIYTDRSSLRQHYQRIQRVVATLLFANVATGAINATNAWDRPGGSMSTGLGIVVAFQAIVVLLLGYGWVALGRKIKEMA